MSYIPDCRTDKYYCVERLSEKDRAEVAGYDWCAEQVVSNFFDNDMGDLADPETYLGHLLCEELPEDMQESDEVKTYADYIRMNLLDWIERERDEMIVSMIEGSGEEE